MALQASVGASDGREEGPPVAPGQPGQTLPPSLMVSGGVAKDEWWGVPLFTHQPSKAKTWVLEVTSLPETLHGSLVLQKHSASSHSGPSSHSPSSFPPHFPLHPL